MAFYAVFAVFALSMVAIAVLAVRWAVGRDRDERERRAAAGERHGGPQPQRPEATTRGGHPARPAHPG